MAHLLLNDLPPLPGDARFFRPTLQAEWCSQRARWAIVVTDMPAPDDAAYLFRFLQEQQAEQQAVRRPQPMILNLQRVLHLPPTGIEPACEVFAPQAGAWLSAVACVLPHATHLHQAVYRFSHLLRRYVPVQLFANQTEAEAWLAEEVTRN